MAPYTPPNTHYSQMDVSSYSDEEMFKFVGRNGNGFTGSRDFLNFHTSGTIKNGRLSNYGGHSAPFKISRHTMSLVVN